MQVLLRMWRCVYNQPGVGFEWSYQVLTRQWAMALWWGAKFFQEGRKAFENVIVFRHLTKAFKI